MPSIVAALVVPAVFLAYVARYSVNVPVVDEWFRVPLLHDSLHGNLTLGGLWAQYNETRIFLGNVVFVVFGFVDHFDVRSLAFFNAAVFIVTFWLFLMVFRTYLGNRPGPLSILVIGVVWFSLADSENPLYGFQVPWYLVVFFFVLMTYLLLVPNTHRNLALFLAILAATAASTAIIQGFVLWPVGLICLVWVRPWVRRTYIECGAWIAAAALTAAVYSIGFDFHDQACGPDGCTAHFALQHPAATFRFLLVLVGNAFIPNPTQPGHIQFSAQFGDRELFGALILLAAALVVALSLLERRTKMRPPLPIVLITFGVLYDFTVAIGRAYFEPGALINRYVMPTLLLLLGIVVYALAHIPRWESGGREESGAPCGAMGRLGDVRGLSRRPGGRRHPCGDRNWSCHRAGRLVRRAVAGKLRSDTATTVGVRTEFGCVPRSLRPAQGLGVGSPITRDGQSGQAKRVPTGRVPGAARERAAALGVHPQDQFLIGCAARPSVSCGQSSTKDS